MRSLCHIVRLILALAAAAGILSGCGYRIYGRQSLAFSEVHVASIENKTYEPKLQDRLNQALTEELLRQGVSVSRTAAHALSCTISRFDIQEISEKSGVVTEYNVVVDVDCKLSDAKGVTVAATKVKSPFFVPFAASQEFGRLIANKEVAEDQAMADLAVEIVGNIIFR